ncbi:type IV secretion system protein VirB5 [Bartonella japonica]|uniref:Type IV secretion system protein VirB5 n=1 Tax=Bartonella japonica TaxID=357761 RepID=A0ABV2FLP8_9HYPH
MKRIIILVAMTVILGASNPAMAFIFGGVSNSSSLFSSSSSKKQKKPTPPSSKSSPPSSSWPISSPFPPPAPTPSLSPSALQELLELLRFMKQHVKLNEQQLNQIGMIYKSITGSGKAKISIDYNSFFLKSPQSIYNDQKNLDIISLLANILEEEEKISNSVDESRNFLEARTQYAAAVDQAVSLQTFEEAENRFQKISELIEKINTTADLKSIVELQTRMKGMLTMIQNETAKLHMVAHLRNAEQALISQQKQKRNMRTFNSKNRTMPTIRFIR